MRRQFPTPFPIPFPTPEMGPIPVGERPQTRVGRTQ